jgi:hypothetical protein
MKKMMQVDFAQTPAGCGANGKNFRFFGKFFELKNPLKNRVLVINVYGARPALFF